MTSIKYRSIILLVFLLAVNAGSAQMKVQSSTDSVTFARLAETFKKNADSVYIDRNAAIFFEKASQLHEVCYRAQAAAIISESYFEKLNKREGETWYVKAQNLYNTDKNYLEAGLSNLKIGNLLTRNYDFETGLPYLLKSVDDFAKTDDYNRQATAYNRLSLAYHDFGNYEKGIAYAQEAFKVLDSHKKVINKNLFWYVYNNLGINYDDSKQPLKAIEAHLNALPFAINASDSSYSYNNLGNTFKKLGNLSEAEKYFNLSFQHSTDYKDQYHLATVYSNMVDIMRLRKNYGKAIYFLDSALYYARLSGSPEKLLDIYYYSYQIKQETGNYTDAIQYLHDHLKLKDSFFTADKNNAVLHYQARYETEKKERELAEAQLNLTKSKLISNQKNILLIILGLAFGLALLLLFYLKSRSRMKEKQLMMENNILQQKAAAEVQRQRLEISRNLHDSMGAQLTLIGSTADRLLTGQNHSEETIRRLNTLSQLSESAVTELKNTLWVLNAKVIQLSDLRMKMLNFINQAAEAEESIQFHFNFDVTEDIPIASRQAVNLIRLVQELTNNSIKHANATIVEINLLQNGKVLFINFSDNGQGFDIAETKDASFGLNGIQTRVAEMNGRLDLNSSTCGTNYGIEIFLY